jgi:DNA-binding GntR family transcriptional regulator
VVGVPAPPQPLFQQVLDDVTARIRSGELAPGARLPSERWFALTLGVSRTTVRRAMEELLDLGLVESGGRGLVVARPAPTVENRLVTLTEIARARGLEPTSRVCRAEARPATLDEADVMHVAPGAAVFDLVRVRMLDGVEIAVDHDRVPMSVLPNALELDFTTASLYGEMELAGAVLSEARTQIEACAASDDEAIELGLDPGVPVLVATERLYDEHDRVICLGRTVYRSDRHRFLATFSRRRKDSAPVRAARERATDQQQGAA